MTTKFQRLHKEKVEKNNTHFFYHYKLNYERLSHAVGKLVKKMNGEKVWFLKKSIRKKEKERKVRRKFTLRD